MNNNNNSKKGFAMPVIIGVVAVVLVFAGVVYYTKQPQVGNDKTAPEKARVESSGAEKDSELLIVAPWPTDVR